MKKPGPQKKQSSLYAFLLISVLIVVVFLLVILVATCAKRNTKPKETLVESGLGLPEQEIVGIYGKPAWKGVCARDRVGPGFQIPIHYQALRSFDASFSGTLSEIQQQVFISNIPGQPEIKSEPVFVALLYLYWTSDSDYYTEIIFLLGPAPVDNILRCYWIYINNIPKNSPQLQLMKVYNPRDYKLNLSVFGAVIGTKSQAVVEQNGYPYNFRQNFYCTSDCKFKYSETGKKPIPHGGHVTYHISDPKPVIDYLYMTQIRQYTWLLNHWLLENRPVVPANR